MRDFTEIRGLRFPDVNLVRFFFKRGHDRRRGRVVELGCGNGINLALYDAYGWDVTGIDISPAKLEAARHNLEGRGTFLQHDLAKGCPLDGPFDAIIMASSMYYIPRQAFVLWLKELARLRSTTADLYLRMRLLDDYRFGRGRPAEHNGFFLTIEETGEAGCLNVFYTEDELKSMLVEHAHIPPTNTIFLRNAFDNLQSNVIVTNSETVIWARL